MRKPQLELADVVRRFLGAYQEQFGDLMLPSHHRALQDIAQCMTETMGNILQRPVVRRQHEIAELLLIRTGETAYDIGQFELWLIHGRLLP